MQAVVAAMAAHAMSMSTLSTSLLAPTVPAMQSGFVGVSVRVSNVPFLAVTSSRSLTVVAATKKAVAVLKGSSQVEGVVNLTQEDSGTHAGSPPVCSRSHTLISLIVYLSYTDLIMSFAALCVTLCSLYLFDDFLEGRRY